MAAPTPNIPAAERFLWLTARLLERHRYAYLFNGGGAEAVLAALRSYQNADGGFGNGLEPDGRGAESQPLQVYTALHVLDEAGLSTDPIVARAIDYLSTVTTPEGGVPAVLPRTSRDLLAPWVDPGSGPAAAALLPTAGIAGILLKNGVRHPWLTAAIEFCWRAIDALDQTHPYEVEFSLTFLQHAPDQDRAVALADRVGRLVRERGLVLVDPDRTGGLQPAPGYGPGEFHTPLDYAPTPRGPARRWFTDAEIERSLDALAAAQGDDGGWHFNWRQWNPMTTLESRGAVTLRALTILRAYGRVR